SDVIPKKGNGWKGKEAFLFEIDFWPKSITFKTVISPGNEEVRSKLSEIIGKIKGAKQPLGTVWLVHLTEKCKYDVTNPHNTPEQTEKKVLAIWPKISEIVHIVENEIIKNFNYIGNG
ncbi:MAG: hypothetical protein D6677_12140, partial [Calditrichaeota bacterium]